MKTVKLVLYADDTNIFIIGNDKNNLIQKGNQILKAVNEFMKSNLLHINLDKCYYMHFCPKAVKTWVFKSAWFGQFSEYFWNQHPWGK